MRGVGKILSRMACRLLDEESAKSLLDNVDTFIIDCEGVLWNRRGAIPLAGCLDAIRKLRKAGKNMFYISNDSSKTRRQFLEKFRSFGFPDVVRLEEIMCASYLSALYLKELGYKHKVFLVGNAAMGSELDQQGIPHIGLGPYPFEGSIKEWTTMAFDPQVKCVLVGLDDELSYMKVLHAATYLQRADCLFLATSLDTHEPVPGSRVRVPGAGTMVEAVKLPSEREPTILGKPQPHMFRLLQETHDLDPARCVVVGDNLNEDMGLAKACGLKSLLVLTGDTCNSDLPTDSTCQSIIQTNMPDLYTASLADIASYT